ncbi:MAG: hypothetical protein EXR85_04760 [Xanthomonadales bacterium]|nr:hypothetical protein [Xanthomonadales bacterium]
MIAPRGKGRAWKLAVKILLAGSRSAAPLLLILLATVMPAQVSAQSEPAWVSPTALASADGSATLKWSVIGDDPIALFRVTEEHAGARQVSYTDQPQLQVLRTEQGKYTFLVQACTRLADGYPQCGEVSQPLVLTVTVAANPEDPPAPVGAPDMTVDAASSRVGSTAGFFRVDVSGNANYSIPLLTAPASGGLAPHVSIDWSSQAGNGHLGVGGSLGGLSVISRCPQTIEQDGVKRPVGITLSASDRFCLDGRRLIATAGAYGANGTEYRAELDTFDKVVSYGIAGAGPAYFTVWHKNGNISQYGSSADSRIEARSATDAQTVLTWALNKTADQAGNYVNHLYSEQSGSASGPVEYMLASIQYTGNSTSGTLPHAQLDFIYTSGRSDAVKTAAAGGSQVQNHWLQRIDSLARINSASALVALRSWHLDYGTDGYGRMALQSVTECNNAQKLYCFAPTRFDWQYSRNGISSSGLQVGSVFNVQHSALAFADFSGDGRPDLLLTEKSGTTFVFRTAVALASGGFSAPSTTTYTIPGNGSANLPVALQAIDLNADGFEDVIYPSTSGWQARVSNGTGLGAASGVSGSCCGLTNPPLARIMDFDGDGLADLVTSRAVVGGGTELVLLHNRFSPVNSSVVGFDAAQVLTVNLTTNLFPEQSTGGWFIDTEAPHFADESSTSAPFARPFDYNGDGAVDLLVRLSQRYVKCGTGCVPRAPGTTDNSPTRISRFIIDESAATATRASSGESYAWASFYVVLKAAGDYTFVRGDLLATGDDCTVSDACSPFSALPRVQRIHPVDVNADGLADVAYQDAFFQWQAQINSGAGLLATSIPIVKLTDLGVSSRARFVDITGDGFPEFIYPSATAQASAKWVMHENRFGAGFAAALATSTVFGDSDQQDVSAFLDINADGFLDNLFVDRSSLGTVESSTTRVYPGGNTTSTSGAGAINGVTGITDGFGARTTINYLPLSNTVVYTRMRDSKNARWGQLSAVHDVIAPVYVVSKVQSGAPVFGNAQAQSSVEYHYLGAKLQSGGRGFLGFGEVVAYDPQSRIRTNTRYRQDFPFVGMAADVTRVLVGTGLKLGPISNPVAISPETWPIVTAMTAAPATASGTTLLSYSINQAGRIATVAGKAIFFPFAENGVQRFYALSGVFDYKTLTTTKFDTYGNAIEIAARTYDADGTSVFASTTTQSTFTTDLARWRLGQETSRFTTQSRAGTANITRELALTYDAQTGLLRQEIVEPNRTAFKVTTAHTLDPFGNRLTTTVTGYGMSPRSRSVTFDPLGRFVVKPRNALSQQTAKTTQWDALGNALAMQDIDGTATVTAVDFMGRPFISWVATGAMSKTIRRSGAGSYCPAADTAYYSVETGNGRPAQQRCFDRLGREVRSASQGFDGRFVYIDRYYDESGRPERVSEPYFAAESRYWNQTAYDALGRVDSLLSADGDDMTYDYDSSAGGCIAGTPRLTRTTNSLGQVRLEQRNALGETTRVYDHLCGKTGYEFDAGGNLVRVTGVDGAATTAVFDLGGRKVSLDDPDKGFWQYGYNPLGEMTRQLDEKSQAIDLVYDQLGRVIHRRELTSVSSLGDNIYTTVNHEEYSWNNSVVQTVKGKGAILQQVYRSGEAGAVLHQRQFSYDSFGRPGLVSTTVDSMQFAEETTYDGFGRPFQQFDASGGDNGVRFHYNSRGFLEKVQEAREGVNGKTYQQIQSVDARGNPTYMKLANGVAVFASYQPQSGRIKTLEAYDVNGMELQYVSYLFDTAGNLTLRYDTSRSNNLQEKFNYDVLNRLEQVLLSVNGGVFQSTLSMRYTNSGNISYKSDVGNYQYGPLSAGPHAATQAGAITFTYDANGNQLTSSDGRAISYSLFDQATSIVKENSSTRFEYGIANERIKRIDSNSVDGVKTTWTLGSVERIQQGSNNPFFKRSLAGIAVADYYPATGVQNTVYLVKDHLGSIHTTTTASGTVADSSGMSFNAFGERRNTTWSGPLTAAGMFSTNGITTRGFTGHEHADGLGIIHMNGRIYDPRIGRFLQADPIVQDPRNSQSLNRYTYVFNNPLSYTDPSGYFGLSYFIKKWGRVIVGAVAGYFTFGAASAWAFSLMPSVAAGVATTAAFTASAAIGGAAAGFVGGAIVSGSLKGAVRGAFAGALTGGVAGYFGNTYSLNRIAADGVTGGVSAEIFGQKFKDGLILGTLISSATYLSVKLRAYQKAQSEQFPGQIGQSPGFRGITDKIAGERIYEESWVESGAAAAFERGMPLDEVFDRFYIPNRRHLSPLGGLQGGPGLLFNRPYAPGGFVDYVLEGYSGVHDSFNQSFFYTGNGTNITFTSPIQKAIGYFINPANVVVATPIVLPSLFPDYLRFLYFAEQAR